MITFFLANPATTTTTSALEQFLNIQRIWPHYFFSATTTVLPGQCLSYVTNSDSTRNAGYGTYIGCDSGTFGVGTWVRFVSPAGTLIPNYVVGAYYCGTHATGWFTGVYPSSPATSTSGTVCFNWSGISCYWSSSITITHCGTYYVFYIRDPPACSLRYCTI